MMCWSGKVFKKRQYQNTPEKASRLARTTSRKYVGRESSCYAYARSANL